MLLVARPKGQLLADKHSSSLALHITEHRRSTVVQNGVSMSECILMHEFIKNCQKFVEPFISFSLCMFQTGLAASAFSCNVADSARFQKCNEILNEISYQHQYKIYQIFSQATLMCYLQTSWPTSTMTARP